jgi:hypothetical protein
MDKVYTFYLNNAGLDEGIWGCVAGSENEAFDKADKNGLKDFFLSSIDDVPPEAVRENALANLLENPNLGRSWLPLAEAFEILNLGLNEKFTTWGVNTLMGKNGYSPDGSPYAQAIVESDGSLHLEVSGKLANKDMSDEDLRLLEFIGWTVSDLEENQWEEREGLPNPYRLFPVGWGGLQVAAFTLETLIAVYGFKESDYFDFSKRATSKILANLLNLERVKIHPGNPYGTLFRLIQPEDPAV